MAHKLVIVESPAKARNIAGMLGRGYVVESSIGHIRDLPQSAADIPAKLKGEPWARLGVNVDDGFKPVYVVSRDKKAHISKLKGLLHRTKAPSSVDERHCALKPIELLHVLDRVTFYASTKALPDHLI